MFGIEIIVIDLEKSVVNARFYWEKSVISILYPYRDSINYFC